MKVRYIIPICLIAVLLWVGYGYWRTGPERTKNSLAAEDKKSVIYYCPMHPDYTADKPGQCPICGMNLVPKETGTFNSEHSHGSGEVLVPSEGSPSSTAPSGLSPVSMTTEQQSLIGLQTVAAREMDLEKTVRTVGRVGYDETRLYHVHVKFEGYIEELYVNYVGDQVTKGQPLFSVYSPEVLATENELLLAIRSAAQKGADTQRALPGISLVESARKRLALWDIDPDDIKEVEKTGKPLRAVRIRSPVNGFVVAKTALVGMRIGPAETAYDIADLSTVWISADVYEADVPFVKVGQGAQFSLSYVPGKVFQGKVTYVYPTLDEKTRTVQVRLELDNSPGVLKPGMFGDVELKADLGKGIVVPESAILSTGERQVVFIAKTGGTFEPREIITGVKLSGFYQIKAGIASGDQVVTEANFLLDSESKLKSALAGVAAEHHHEK